MDPHGGSAGFYAGVVLLQRDYANLPYPAPGYESATVASGGCGPVSVANALRALGIETTVPRIVNMALSGGARVSGGTQMGRLLALAAKKYPVEYRAASELRALTAHGGVAVANAAGRGVFSLSGHYLTVLHCDGARVRIADAGWYPGKYDARRFPARAAVTERGPGLLDCAPAVLDGDCTGRSPRYYLLTRR